MKTTNIILLSFLFLRCADEHAKNRSFTDIQLSYGNGWDVSSSLKVTKMDSVMVRDNTIGKCFVGKLETQERETLDSLLYQVDIFQLDSTYKPIGYSMNDCSSFRLFVKIGNRQKTITSKCTAPEQLKIFKRWLVQMSKVAKTPVNCIADFKETDRGYYTASD